MLWLGKMTSAHFCRPTHPQGRAAQPMLTSAEGLKDSAHTARQTGPWHMGRKHRHKLGDTEEVWGWAVRMRAGPGGVPTVITPGTMLCGNVANALWDIVMRQPYTDPGLFGKSLAGPPKADPRTSWPGFDAPVTTLVSAHHCSGITPGQTCAPAWPSVIP